MIAVSEISPPVGQTVDEESGVLNENSLSEATNEEAAKPITPSQTGNQSRQDNAQTKGEEWVVLVLECYRNIISYGTTPLAGTYSK